MVISVQLSAAVLIQVLHVSTEDTILCRFLQKSCHFFFSVRTATDAKSPRALFVHILSYETLLFNIAITISYVFFLVMNLILDFTCVPPLFLTSAVWSPGTFSKCQWKSMGAIFSSRKGIPWCIFTSYALAYQVLFCQSTSLLPRVAWQQNAIQNNTECDGILAGKSMYCRATNSCFWWCGPTLIKYFLSNMYVGKNACYQHTVAFY